jgi:cytochrome c biogenesis protein CcmG/thiol:disulfide interchange protein DsbE
MRWVRIGVLAAGASAALAIALQPKASPPRPAPPLPRQALVRPPAVTLAALRGRPVLVSFWASWCEPCRREAPALAAFAAGPAGRGHLVGVDTGDDLGAARRFVARYGWTFPLLRDQASTTAVDYRLPGLPTTVELDARGRIVAELYGAQTGDSLARALAAAGRA